MTENRIQKQLEGLVRERGIQRTARELNWSDAGNLLRMVKGKNMWLSKAQRLADGLGYELQLVPKKKKGRRHR